MRDISRIDPLLQKLGEAWKKTPDQRFGQFMYHFFSLYGKDPFYAEDDAWMVGLQAYIDGQDIAQAMEAYQAASPASFSIDFDSILQSVKQTLETRDALTETLEPSDDK